MLDLSWNHFKTTGAVAIAEGLQVCDMSSLYMYDAIKTMCLSELI